MVSFAGAIDWAAGKSVATFVLRGKEGEGCNDSTSGGRGIDSDRADATGHRRGNAAPCLRCDCDSSGRRLYLKLVELPGAPKTLHLAGVGGSCNNRWCHRPSSGIVGFPISGCGIFRHSNAYLVRTKCF